jgi:GNAT superfamily N-acetyltransferase
VREASPADLVLLPEIDERADTVFRMAGYDLPEVPFREDEWAAAKAVFVLGRPPVGFARVDEVDDLAHLAEMAVIPGSMRQGIGASLLERSCEWARAHGYPAITLTTYADVAWNGPYYAARGFVETGEVTPGLARLRERERTSGLDDVGRRVVMRRDLSG